MIRCENIYLKFGENIVFDNLNIHIKQGENVCIVGNSGTGKTSFLKLLLGNIKAQSGKIFIDGLEFNKANMSAIATKMVWLPQNINMPVANGSELISLMAMNNRIRLINNNLQCLSLDVDILAKSFKDISGGEKQRIMAAICLSINRPIILMDEPTSALDAVNSALLVNLIKSLKEKTIISVSHDNNWIKTTDRQIHLIK